jgi:hypothetical protein
MPNAKWQMPNGKAQHGRLPSDIEFGMIAGISKDMWHLPFAIWH